ncbi:MAG TPA: TdeIII family type II restriction endonuclease [Candidatus Kapabacteria bacterium]|nr:TdeIII family type II restriction endonuclease [Candidatus Kapabacteria bacterium]HPP39427.1 TdeIII family type II restriction endonuclease [Candidatus Kapabacteria bacterium]
MTEEQKTNVIDTIIKSLRKKLSNYKPETVNMPFHYRLLGRDRMALYSFIQSLNTTFGTSIFEPVALAVAKGRFAKVRSHYEIGNTISEGSQQAIQSIINRLSVADTAPNKQNELDEIRRATNTEKINIIKTVKADIFLENKGGEMFFIDLKTAKPNISNFKDFKRTLLEWAAIAYTQNIQAKIHTLIAIPYNPYEPKPYERWTIKGMLDDKHELMVGREFWDFLGGRGTYDNLLECFEIAGIQLRTELDNYFIQFT